MKTFWQDKDIAIYNCDGRKTDFLPNNYIDIVITSPPYYCCEHLWGELWKKLSIQNLNDYNEWMQLFYNEWFRILKNGRYVIVNTSHINEVKDDKKIGYNNPAYTAVGLEKAGFTFADNIIWKKTKVCSPRFGTFVNKRLPRYFYPNNVYEVWLVYIKGQPEHNVAQEIQENLMILDPIKETCRNDIWEFETESAAKVGHVAPFPASLVYKFIQLYSFPGEVVLDPFAGSGTVGMAASLLKRKSIMIDIDTNFCEHMQDKFENRGNIYNE